MLRQRKGRERPPQCHLISGVSNIETKGQWCRYSFFCLNKSRHLRISLRRSCVPQGFFAMAVAVYFLFSCCLCFKLLFWKSSRSWKMWRFARIIAEFLFIINGLPQQ